MTFDKRKGFVAVLDTMWGAGGRAPQWFLISDRNASGRRLYALTRSQYGNVAVVNACPQQASHANGHGTPDPVWLAASLRALPGHYTRRGVPLLVCGKVAQRTYSSALPPWNGPVLFIDHPAARCWTKAKIAAVTRQIAAVTPKRWSK